ncbi:MAG TPA: hypothetical protein DDW54_01980, partial [Clostridiales bacterium]|nr:hypothetical protein [Clostridiales bacterium]
MDFENCKDIFISEGEESDVIIKPRGKAAEFYFDCEKKKDKRYKLFVSGETGLFYMWRNEPDYPSLYHTLTDALCHKETMRAQYSLDVSRNTAENFEWRAYKKIMWPPVLSYLPLVPLGEKWKVGFWAKAENLAAEKGGKILMRVCVYGKKEGLSVHSLFQPLTENIEIPIEQGSYGWKKTEREITVPKDETAFVGVWFEGVGYTGKVYIERPFLVSDNGYNVLPDFSVAQPKKEKFAWAAQNLSRKEWPKFSVKLNGEEIFSGEKFERIHRNASWETDIPSDLLKEKNVLSVSLISDCYAATPYAIKEVRLIEQSGGDISVIAAPEYTSENAEFPVLIRTGKDGATVRAKSGKTYSFEEKGLHVIRLNARTDAEGGKFVLKCGNFEACGDVPVAAPKEDDGVITGTGDMIYVAQDESEVEEYLSWFFSNGLGNFLTIRPTYRWSSTREVNVKVWKKVKEIL